MIGHQRAVLAQLGIDIWISRDSVCQKVASSPLWRDQVRSEIVTHLAAPSDIKAPITVDVDVVASSIASPKSSIDMEAFKVVDAAQIQQTEAIVREQSAQDKIAAFSLQAIQLVHMVIVVNSTHLTAQQQQLWANIQRAANATFFELNWPFAAAEMNDADGVENYIQGFMDMISHDKQMISLGPLPYWNNRELMPLASLQDMLDQPLLKRRLWNFIQHQQNVAG
ncbi:MULTISPECIES: hypothetical protein [unclassified Acinetobacter]|uniref:hypothetical protein n=1 Tax=unclassified Acinetobacter TaxID=196816 RepID=UPI002934EFD2|nr:MULTISPECIES: hypothetical protein [unclassified Acinetobacter]WOE31719.1 hypothetical protein QSG84_00340 [Acinetobacter sp. SAAs470]WOE37186.1 hypothetical protein QSG86_09385 [Acinetobacter sp. SAAs474]